MAYFFNMYQGENKAKKWGNSVLTKAGSNNALNNNLTGISSKSGSTLRDQVLMNQRHASWGLLRNRIINAKISDALSNIKFTINGKSLRALR